MLKKASHIILFSLYIVKCSFVVISWVSFGCWNSNDDCHPILFLLILLRVIFVKKRKKSVAPRRCNVMKQKVSFTLNLDSAYKRQERGELSSNSVVQKVLCYSVT